MSWIPESVGSTTMTPKSIPLTEAITGQPIPGGSSFKIRSRLSSSAICLAFCLTRVTSLPEFSSHLLHMYLRIWALTPFMVRPFITWSMGSSIIFLCLFVRPSPSNPAFRLLFLYQSHGPLHANLWSTVMASSLLMFPSSITRLISFSILPASPGDNRIVSSFPFLVDLSKSLRSVTSVMAPFS